MKVQETTDQVVRGLLGMGIAATVMALIGWTPMVAPLEVNTDHSSVFAEVDPLQEIVLYGAIISPLDDQGIRGYAVILPSDEGGAEIMVDAHGVEPSVEHMQHVHSGASCSNIGGVVQPLEPYPEANDEGEIHYRETFDSMPDNPGDRVVVIHGADGAPVACGELDAVNR